MPINKTTIKNLTGAVDTSLREGRLGEALSNLDSFARAASMHYDVTSRISSLADSYAMLSRFLIEGVADPERDAIAADIAAEATEIRNSIERSSLATSDEPTLYFSTLRFEQTRRDETITALVDTYTKAIADNMPAATTESLATRLFNRVWVTFPLNAQDAEVLHSVLASSTIRIPHHARMLLIGALLLGSLQYFDRRRAIILADIYRINHDKPIGAVALTALILSLAAAPSYATGNRKLAAALAALGDVPSLKKDASMAFMQLIRSRDTERVSKKMTDELLPGIMKLRPDIDKRMRDMDAAEANPFDEEGGLNPEWEELFEKSGLGDKLRELNELQSEGADVMMATMGGLKDFSFFNDPANWFLPFYQEHSLASPTGIIALSKSIDGLPMMCNGDKYSLVLLAGRMGGSTMSTGMAAHLEEQEKQWKELLAADLEGEAKARTDAANSFVQDVYRFFKLFRRKGEFDDPFVKPVNPLSTPLLSSALANDADALTVPAEFYFRRGHYAEALQIFKRIEELVPPSAELYQKKGYALELTGSQREALDAYHTADLIDSESVWTLRRIAAMLRATGRHDEALTFYERIQALKPDKRGDVMARANCLMELHRYSDALALLYKADYLKPDRIATLRPMARCQLITGEARKAMATCTRIAALPDTALTADDHITRGHAALALADYRGAIDAYADAMAAMAFDKKLFYNAIEADRKLMERIGADALTVNIITEAAIDIASKRGSNI